MYLAIKLHSRSRRMFSFRGKTKGCEGGKISNACALKRRLPASSSFTRKRALKNPHSALYNQNTALQ